MAQVGGIDLGGTKIEARLFGADWSLVATRRIATPARDYDAMIAALADQVDWLREEARDHTVPVGVGSPGLISPTTGLALTANLPATGRPLAADLSAKVGQTIPFLNDVRAFTLSEANLGAGRGHGTVAGIVMGTGVAGGLVTAGAPLATLNGLAGELGHCPIPQVAARTLNLPLYRCGCGRDGCFETLLAGPGLSALALHLTGAAIAPEALSERLAAGDAKANDVYDTWLQLAAHLIDLVMMTADPHCIVLGGGLSYLPDLPVRLCKATARLSLAGVQMPAICLAEGGDASGARGAALYAAQLAERDR